ncbi:hypothetical protein F7725_007746 [Dissostichus mawsoni]|uniref:Uncharacterized protein n=1 Tax=Dissostichus mawsoni TaxID=36200 RepID=A0A7J5Y661_DISMA|nr:hypothetical protein F7725_007746 [Dissostichus mawsoni]
MYTILRYPVDNISSLKVMEEWTSGLTSSFSSVFSQEDVVRILGVFENLGVGSTEDLKYVEADDLAKFLKPIEVRKVMACIRSSHRREMDDSSSIATSQNEEASTGEDSLFSDNDEIALNVHSTPKITATWSLGSAMRSQPFSDNPAIILSFEVPWNKMASNTRRSLETEKRPSAAERREVVRIVVAEILSI